MTLPNIFKDTVDMNLNSLKECEIQVLFLDFSLEMQVEYTTSFELFTHLQKQVLREYE